MQGVAGSSPTSSTKISKDGKKGSGVGVAIAKCAERRNAPEIRGLHIAMYCMMSMTADGE